MPGDTLLNQSTAKIGVDEAAFGSLYCFPQAGVGDEFLPCKPSEPLRLESSHRAIPNTMNYSTENYISMLIDRRFPILGTAGIERQAALLDNLGELLYLLS